jgi:hypothetical protein
MEATPGATVSVRSGDNETDLGQGTYLGEVTVYYFVSKDGTLIHTFGHAETEPPWDIVTTMKAEGCELARHEGNPKIRLDNGEIVYGCQVWWVPIESTH